MKVLFVSTFYQMFLDEIYASRPELAEAPYQQQLQGLMATGFGVSDSLSVAMRAAGWEAIDVISNASQLQRSWAAENGFEVPEVRTWHHDILEAQVRKFGPDVIYVLEYNPVGDACLARLKTHVPLLVGQIASNLPPHRTFDAYDLMVSSWPPIVDHFNRNGGRGVYQPLAFDQRVLARLGDTPPTIDVTFVGGFASCHGDRLEFLERLCPVVDIEVYGYGADTLPANSPVLNRHRGLAWGNDMYRILQTSKITLNLHAQTDVRGCVSRRFANNMRLYEATGMGTCLLTEARDNLHELFKPEAEVLTYRDFDECVEKISVYLADEDRRRAVAQAGQQRTLREHTFTQRMAELKDAFELAIRRKR